MLSERAYYIIRPFFTYKKTNNFNGQTITSPSDCAVPERKENLVSEWMERRRRTYLFEGAESHCAHSTQRTRTPHEMKWSKFQFLASPKVKQKWATKSLHNAHPRSCHHNHHAACFHQPLPLCGLQNGLKINMDRNSLLFWQGTN